MAEGHMTFEGPTGAPVGRRIEIAGMSTLEFGDPDRPVDLVFLHANGFHAHLYASLLEPLAEGRRILAPDLRGFGRTTLSADPAQLRSWNTFRDDLLAMLEEVDARDVVLAGHSMGATTSLLAAAEAPARVRAVALVEPVIAPSLFYVAMNFEPARRAVVARFPLARNAARRRAWFADRDAAFAAYSGRGAFRTWPEDALRAYVDEGFVEEGADGNGGVRLRCDPAWESAAYGAQANGPWRALARLRAPLFVRAGEAGSTFPPAAEKLMRWRRSWRGQGQRPLDIARISGATHFLPQEKPDIVREMLTAALATAATE